MDDFIIKTSYLFLLSCFIGSASAGDFTHSRYDDMKTDFLNVDTTNIKIVDMSEMQGEDPAAAFTDADINSYQLEFDDKGFTGSNSWCNNEYGETAFCFTATGSFSKTRMWLGVGESDDHVSTVMFGAGDTEKPLNRWCVEYQLDPTKVTYNEPEYDGNPERSQVVNEAVAHDDLEHHEISLGTYTSPFNSNTKSIDKETSGSFNADSNTHYYHQGFAYGRTSNVRVFALSEKTFVGCFGPNPRGIRSSGRPPFNSNPFMTVVGDNDEGRTDAYSYMNYLTRFYWDLESDHVASATFPFTMTINKFWMMYEENEILAYTGNGSVLGVDMVESGNTATYPFMVNNDASEDRTYVLQFMAGGNLPLRGGDSNKFDHTHFRVYEDVNQDQTVDGGDIEVYTFDNITLTANTDKHFIIQHTPDFSDADTIKQRWSRYFAPGNVLLLETDRMRYASYSVRTWEGSAADVTNKATILPTIVYQDAGSDYLEFAAFNQDRESLGTINNVRLLRYNPDFLRVFGVVPIAPTNVTIN